MPFYPERKEVKTERRSKMRESVPGASTLPARLFPKHLLGCFAQAFDEALCVSLAGEVVGEQ